MTILRSMTITLLLFSVNGWSVTAEEERDFRKSRSYEFPGCPANSKCSEEYGKTHAAWIKIFTSTGGNIITRINNFKSRYGIPLGFWSLTQNSSKDQIFWDSPCQQHRKPGKEIYLSQMFFSGPFTVKREGIVERVAIIKSNDTMTLFSKPYGLIPTHLDSHGRLMFVMEERGSYFTLAIGKEGETSVLPVSFPTNSAEVIDCAKGVIDKFSKELGAAKTPFRFYSCKRLWSDQLKSWQTVIFGFSC
jgi:hypothetical protein